MISFRRQDMLKLLRVWLENNRIVVIVFILLILQGAFLGLSDDEAYYWVLSQKLSLSYAFHPPAVAWLIALFEKPIQLLFHSHHPGIVRLPAALGASWVLYLGLQWLRVVGLTEKQLQRSSLVLLSFCGFFSLAWMIVPDIPLFFAWTLLFFHTWIVCFKRYQKIHLIYLAIASALVILSKYSGVLAVFSSFLCLSLWAPRSEKKWALISIICGIFTASIPILLWNSQHQWASILYQIHDRHEGGTLSWLRYLRFWAIQFVIAGPGVLVVFAYWKWKLFLYKRKTDPTVQFIALWVIPASIFLIQPLYSDFKIHWAFIVWWPIVLLMAWMARKDSHWKWLKLQAAYGLILGIFILISCHIPLGSWLIHAFTKENFDPRKDVTSDFYGWSELKQIFHTELSAEDLALPRVGSRYQTASQTAFYLGGMEKTTLLPRDYREKEEWPELGVAVGWGPSWPKLTRAILFIGDNRYDAPPQFPGAVCRKLRRFEVKRWNFVARWFDVWRCDP